MTAPPRKPGAPRAEPVPNPDVVKGDHVYFRHATGPHAAEVLATGRHGITVRHRGAATPVRWPDVLGHKERKAQSYRVIDEGEDGLIVKDADGTRKYITVPPEARGEKMVLDKSFGADAGRLLIFTKAGAIANRPGLTLQQSTDKTGRTSKHWVRTQKELPKVEHGAAANDDAAQPRVKAGDQVSFRNGEHAGTGKVHAVGQHGAIIHDLAGGEHRIKHENIDPPPAGAGSGQDGQVDHEKFSAADFAKKHDDASATQDSIVDSFGPEARGKVEAAQSRLGGVKQTIDLHRDAGGKWNDERAALHRKVIFDGVEVDGKMVPGLLAPERVKAATPPPGQAPTFIALGGRGGSGKSSLNGKVYEESQAIVIDSDHIKGMMPEYAGWNAHEVHEESNHVLESVLELAKILGLNVVLDATMKTGKSLDAKIDAFKGAGFRTEAHYMHLPRQEAAKRAVGRFLNGGEKGRFVPPGVVLGNDKNEENFDNIKSKVDAWSFHDNNRPKAEGPKLIAQKGTPAFSSKKVMTKSVVTGRMVLLNLSRSLS